MIRSVIEHIGGVGIYGVISICMFFTFFVGVMFWAWRLKPSHVKSMSVLPLEDGTLESKPETHSNS
jgi:hypothetical protein